MKRLKLFKACAFYPEAIASLYARDLHLKDQSFAAQYTRLMGSAFQWADFWKMHLEPTGEFEVYEALWNAEHMQKTWAHENCVEYTQEQWVEEILIEQVRKFRPDVFFMHGGLLLPPSFLPTVKREFPRAVLCGYDGLGREAVNDFAGVDIIFSCLSSAVDFYREHGFKADLFKLGFEDSLTRRLVRGNTPYGCSFVGGLFLGQNGHSSRLEFLRRVSDALPVQLHLRCPTTKQYLRSCAGRLIRGDFHRAIAGPIAHLPHLNRLNRINKGPLFGMDMLQSLSDSKTTINIHIDAAKGTAANFRLFEATGVGACLVTDWKENISEFFETDREVVCFRSAEECIEKVKYLLDHEQERAEIASRGQRRTLGTHRLRDSILGAGSFILQNVK